MITVSRALQTLSNPPEPLVVSSSSKKQKKQHSPGAEEEQEHDHEADDSPEQGDVESAAALKAIGTMSDTSWLRHVINLSVIRMFKFKLCHNPKDLAPKHRAALNYLAQMASLGPFISGVSGTIKPHMLLVATDETYQKLKNSDWGKNNRERAELLNLLNFARARSVDDVLLHIGALGLGDQHLTPSKDCMAWKGVFIYMEEQFVQQDADFADVLLRHGKKQSLSKQAILFFEYENTPRGAVVNLRCAAYEPLPLKAFARFMSTQVPQDMPTTVRQSVMFYETVLQRFAPPKEQQQPSATSLANEVD